MSGETHKNLVLDEMHALPAKVYADIIARDADTTFNTATTNVNKLVRVDSPLAYYVLSSITPTWTDLTNLLNTTHRSSSGTDHSDVVLNNAHRVSDGKDHSDVVLNNTHRASDGSDHSFIDQSVTRLASPQFIDLVLTGDLTVQGETVTLDATTLLIEDKNIELGTVVTPTDVTADGGGIILKGATDKTILWNNISDAWDFNQNVHVRVGSSGVTASSTANALVVEDSKNNGLSILTPDTSVGRIIFGSPSDPFGAFLAWGFSGDDFAVGASKIGANFRLTSDLETTNLTLSGGVGSELATFAKDVTVLGSLTAPQVNADNLRLELNTITNTDGAGGINLITNGGTVLILTDRVSVQGTSFGASGSGFELLRFRDDRTTVTSAPNYVLSITRQSSALGALFLGNDGNGDAILVTGDNDLRIGNDVAGAFTENIRFVSGGNVGIGTAVPDTKLHVEGGTAGVVTAFAGTIATFESSGAGYLSILTPDASTRGILFAAPSSNIAAGIFYNDPGSPDGFQFRVNGNQTKMVIESDGAVGIGTTNPDVTAILDLSSTTKGFLPPRLTTVQRDAIISPAPGLEIYNTTVNKPEVFTATLWKTVLTDDLANVVVQETFASTNVRFFGELALPAAQGWTDTATGIATIDLVTQTVFGEVKQVVRHNDNTTGGSTTSKIILTAQNWIDVNSFGASYSGTARLDTANGASGFFSGLQANAAENPLATGNRRYGILFNSDAGNLQLIEADNNPGNSVTMDGTGGNPLITFDEWFKWECVVPAGLGAAEVYINGILTTFIPLFLVNGGGLGTQIIVSSGSTGGANRIAYHDNFGVTIFEEAATKTLAVATMVANVAQINIPEGKRDYTIILPDGNPRLIGSVLKLVASNLGGLISLENQNPAVPEVLYNGLRTLVINIAVKETIEGINTVDQANIYLGFEIAILHVGGKFIDTTDQTIVVAGTPQVITFNTNKIIDDISHTIGSSVFNINTNGTYKFEVAPQVFQGAGAAKIEFWFRKNGTDIVDSGVQSDIGANNQALPILLWKEIVIASDTIECVWASDSGNTKLDNITSLFGGPNIPSIMFRMTLVDT